jgi:hypothetical protein
MMGAAIISPPSECQACHHVCRLGAAEYHPYEFCRIYKAGGNPWRGRKPVLLDQVSPELRARLQERCRRFWRAYYSTEVTLP